MSSEHIDTGYATGHRTPGGVMKVRGNMKSPDPFAEDRGIMSKEPMLDYSWVLHKWVPKGSRPDENGSGGFAFSTEWDLLDHFVDFLVRVRSPHGMFTVMAKIPRLETKAGKEAARKLVQDELDRQIGAKMSMEVKA